MTAEAEDAMTTTDADARKNDAGVNDNMNEADVFECVADKQPDSPCVSFDGEVFTYREFDDYANRFAHALRGRACAPAIMSRWSCEMCPSTSEACSG